MLLVISVHVIPPAASVAAALPSPQNVGGQFAYKLCCACQSSGESSLHVTNQGRESPTRCKLGTCLPGLQRLQEGIKNVLRRFLDDGALIKWSSISIEKLNRLNRGNPSICLSFVVASLHQAKESGLQQLLQPFRPHQSLICRLLARTHCPEKPEWHLHRVESSHLHDRPRRGHGGPRDGKHLGTCQGGRGELRGAVCWRAARGPPQAPVRPRSALLRFLEIDNTVRAPIWEASPLNLASGSWPFPRTSQAALP